MKNSRELLKVENSVALGNLSGMLALNLTVSSKIRMIFRGALSNKLPKYKTRYDVA